MEELKNALQEFFPSTDKETKLNVDSQKKIEDEKLSDEYEIVISEESLDELLSNMSLCEKETIVNEGAELGELESNEDYFPWTGPSDNLKKLSPWTRDGPIIKDFSPDDTMNFIEMEKLINKEHCTCFLIGCDAEVFTKNIQKGKLTPWYFMCEKHQIEVTKRYGYGPKKNFDV